MLKNQIIQLVKDGSQNRFKDRTCALHIGLIWEQMLGQLYSAHSEELDYYTTPLKAQVVRNGKNVYALFPKRAIHFSDLKKGCRSINTEGDVTVQFVPVSLLGRKIYPSINTGDKSIGFEVKKDRAIFDNLPDEINEVVLSLVLPFDVYDGNDDVPMPSGVNELIIQFAIDSLNGKDIPINIHKTPTTRQTTP
jgi:hypothetical protein